MIARRGPAVSALAVAALARPARAQAFPTGPIRLICPLTAGGPADLIARVLAERASVELGQPVVVEPRRRQLRRRRARPDGYTIVIVTGSILIVSLTQGNLPYNFERDLAPIMSIGSFPMAIAMPGASNLRSLADGAALARATDGGISYGSGGVGSFAHLAAANLLSELGVPGTHVPYRGNNEATQGMLGNQVQLFMPTVSDILPFLGNGGIRALGVTSSQRLATVPDVPTTTEFGFPRFDPRIWYGFLAPSGTPSAVMDRLRDAFAKARVTARLWHGPCCLRHAATA